MLQNVVIALSISGVANCLDGVSMQCGAGEQPFIPDFVEDSLLFRVVHLEFVFQLSVVWPDIHGSECVEIVHKLDGVLVLDQVVAHRLGLWLTERIWTRIALVAWSVRLVAPKISIITINVDTLDS